MKRILFVDDERNVLDGLRRMLRSMRQEWEMAFATSGAEALGLMSQTPFDVVVSDMRMPGMDGAQLLTEVMRRHPQTVRIVLSGHSDKEMILRSVGPTHQYLAKPCDPEMLKETVARSCALRELLNSPSLKDLVSQMNSLPSLPDLYMKVVQELSLPNASIQRIGDIISQDVGMTAKILQLVNSAFFGLRRHISTPAMAVNLLGLDTVKSLVLTIQVFSQFEQPKVREFDLPVLWNHSVATGTIARAIAAATSRDVKMADHTLMAGLLHDAGKLVLAAKVPDQYQNSIVHARAKAVPMWVAEREVLGTTHAEVGAYLMGLWGLPDLIVEGIAYHHTPAHHMATTFSPLTAVHVANALEHEAHPSADQAHPFEIRLDYLSGLGLADRLDRWRELARGVLCGQKGGKP